MMKISVGNKGSVPTIEYVVLITMIALVIALPFMMIFNSKEDAMLDRKDKVKQFELLPLERDGSHLGYGFYNGDPVYVVKVTKDNSTKTTYIKEKNIVSLKEGKENKIEAIRTSRFSEKYLIEVCNKELISNYGVIKERSRTASPVMIIPSM
ncbi:hypothetical protein [Alkaliphilus sp. B6464]|uniref:hypothetical protein n=1 Tax=Alkaliphilus sp. B6464 TaxID=2731219 RepID=UPI001BA54916|nr:hypothetical protein [Alkaliphilus sp. B6464]QUH21926.1 hypothetical protein HYG84_18540 [Alkaliphilus sp. B6464]